MNRNVGQINMHIIQKSFFVLVVILGIYACASSGPKTRYYSLFTNSSPEFYQLENSTLSIGVGPIVLPEYIDHPGIVSSTETNRVIVSGYNAWAGDLKENMSRVLASNLSVAFGVDQVWAFPWNDRIKPDYKIRMVFEDFSGMRGGEVRLVARWTLIDKSGKTRMLAEKETIKKTTRSSSYDDYVAALNLALNDLSNTIAEKVSNRLINETVQ